MIFLEIIGTVTGVLSVWLLTRQNSFGWPLGLIYIAVSMILFGQAKLYGELVAHIVFLVLSFHGWIQWTRKQNTNTDILSPTYLNTLERIFYFAILTLMTFGVGYMFLWFTDNILPFLDSLVMSMSFAAMWLQASKKMENWALWMLVNTISIGIYVSQNLYVYAALYCLFLVLAFRGYFTWQRSIDEGNSLYRQEIGFEAPSSLK